MESSLEVTKASFVALTECLDALARLEDLSPELLQQFRRETQNFINGIPVLMEALHIILMHRLAPLINMLPEDEDYPDIVWVRKWFTEPGNSVEETKYLAQYVVKAAAEALASQCQVLKGAWESLCWSLLPVFKECFKIRYYVKFGFVSYRFNTWIIRVVGDPEMCPNPDLRLQMLVLYRWLLKVDDSNREQALDSLILACSYLDRHRETVNIVDMSDIIECLWKFTKMDEDDTYLIQFGVRVATKLRLHRKKKQQILIHDSSQEYAMGLKTLPMPQEFFSLTALLNYIKHETFIQFMAFQEEPYNRSHLDKLEKACEYLSFFGEHLKHPFQEPELLNLTAETTMNVMDTVVRCRYQFEPELNGYDLFDMVNAMLSDLCHDFTDETDEYAVLEPVGHEILSRYKERICKMRTLISKELLDEVRWLSNILYNDKY